MPAALARQKSDPPPNPPFTDKYDVERVIGRGGMGTVFEARHSRLGQRVAIKVLGEELRLHPELVKRFEREARAAGSLSSPHAVRVFDIDQTDDGTPFMVMELLNGRDLGQLIERDGRQAPGMAVRWVIEACDAIGEAHRLGIIHRDIKPSNLLLCDTGFIKVLDFGIAKRVAAKEAAITLGVAPLGTPQYMSPEQIRCAKDVDARSDIWSLGVTLYELVCGVPPFNHDVAAAAIAAIVADDVPDPRTHVPDLDPALASVMMRALAKNPAERFQSVDELVLALAPFADQTQPPDTGSWKVISNTRRLAAKEDTTLDGDDLIVDLVTPAGAIVDVAKLGVGLRSTDEQTVPPAVSRAAIPMRGKRIRSSIAVAAASVLGLAALVATPRCVGSKIEASSAAPVTISHPSHVVAPLEASPIAAAQAEQPAPPETETEPQPAPSAEGTPTTAAPTVTPVKVTASAAAPSKLPPLPRSRASGPVRVIGRDRPVHGGISSPGF